MFELALDYTPHVSRESVSLHPSPESNRILPQEGQIIQKQNTIKRIILNQNVLSVLDYHRSMPKNITVRTVSFFIHVCPNLNRCFTEQPLELWYGFEVTKKHYADVIMGVLACQVTSLTIVYSTFHSGADQRKHQSSASLAFVRGIHHWTVKSPHKGPVTRKMFPFDDVIMVHQLSIFFWLVYFMCSVKSLVIFVCWYSGILCF